MEIEVLNPNKLIRKKIVSLLGSSEKLEESIVKIYEYLDFVKVLDYEKYKVIIGVIFSDFWFLGHLDLLAEEYSEYEYHSNEMLYFTSVDDVINYLEEHPELLDEMLLQTFYFDYMSSESKRKVLLNNSQDSRYIQNINPFHFFDKVEYCRMYHKEYLFYLYQKELIDFNKKGMNIQTSKLLAKLKIEVFLKNIKLCDTYNHEWLIFSLIKDFYILEKYKESNGLCTKANKLIIDKIEKKPIENLLEFANDDLCFVSAIISSFVELNEKKEEEHQKIKSFVCEKTEYDVNVKLLLEL